MTAPIRIQRQRSAGWKMPENTVYVGRPSRWGNPFQIGTFYAPIGRISDGADIQTRDDAVCAFRDMLNTYPRNYPALSEIIHHLRGKNLACWCPLGAPCHAEILLHLANKD